MGMFSRLFKRRVSSTPEDYGSIYVKWERDGKEYGPYQFEDLAESRWSGSPEIGRFAGEKKWRKYDQILEVLSSLRASQEQLTFLREHQIDFDESRLSFLRARQLVGEQQEKVRAAERKEKDKLPATKQYRKKMDGLGISYPDDVTRAQAKALVAEYEGRKEFTALCTKLKKNGVAVPSKVQDQVFAADGDGQPEVLEHLENLAWILEDVAKLGIELDPPESFDAAQLGKHLARLENALAETDDFGDLLEDRDIDAVMTSTA